MAQSRISELSALIQTHTSKIDQYLSSSGLPPLSFDLNSAAALPSELTESQNAILEASEELNALVHGPMSYVMSMGFSHMWLTGLHTVYRYGIISKIPLDGEASFEEISKACGLNEDDTRRMLRHAISHRIFREPRKGIVAHSPASKVLADMPLLHEFIGHVCDDMWPASSHAVPAMVKWPGSQEPNQAGFNIVNNTELPFYEEFAKEAKRAQRFADAMLLFQLQPGLEAEHLLDNYPWASDKPTKVVDIGGSEGGIDIELARRFPSVSCVVQDRPEVVDAVKAPTDVADRVSYMAHDFFAPQPVVGADVYYLRWILHNWSDKYAALILKALVPALRPGSKVIINEMCIPECGILHPYQERYLRAFDIVMKQALNAKERDADDWTRLVRDADPRFKLQEVIQPRGSVLAIIVVGWEDQPAIDVTSLDGGAQPARDARPVESETQPTTATNSLESEAQPTTGADPLETSKTNLAYRDHVPTVEHVPIVEQASAVEQAPIVEQQPTVGHVPEVEHTPTLVK